MRTPPGISLQQERSHSCGRGCHRRGFETSNTHLRYQGESYHQAEGNHQHGQSVSLLLPCCTILLSDSCLTIMNRTGIEREHKQIPLCKKGQPSVAVKIEGPHQP